MSFRNRSAVLAAAFVLASACFSAAEAGVVTLSASSTSGGVTRSATAEFTFGADSLTIVLTNTTPDTRDASELLTGLRFHLDDLTGVLSLVGASTEGRRVSGSGAFTDLGVVNLLTAGKGSKPTWSVAANGPAGWQLDFNPDAKYAIIGAEDASGDYGGANGSIQGNKGHNPFANQVATFTFLAPGLTSSSTLSEATFLFGTDFATCLDSELPPPVRVVPVPPAAALGLVLLAGLGARRLRRRA